MSAVFSGGPVAAVLIVVLGSGGTFAFVLAVLRRALAEPAREVRVRIGFTPWPCVELTVRDGQRFGKVTRPAAGCGILPSMGESSVGESGAPATTVTRPSR